MKLNSSHIEFVFDCMKENTTKIVILKHCFRIKLLNLQIVCPLKRLAYLMKSVALKSIMREQKLLNNQK